MNTPFLKQLALIIAATFILVVASLFQVDQMYMMAAILYLTPLVSYWLGRILLPGLLCEPRIPFSATAGERIPIVLEITNTGWLPKGPIGAAETLPKWLHQTEEERPLILQLWPGEVGAISYQIVAEKRGVYQIGPTQVLLTDPLGLHSYRRTITTKSEIVVYPLLIPTRQSWRTGAAAQGLHGLNDGMMRGNGMDFYGIREYQHGDELRRVHWPTTARFGKMVVTEQTQGVATTVTIALDLHENSYRQAGDGPESALEYAIRIAATMAARFLEQGHCVNLMVPGQADGSFRMFREMQDISLVMDLLARAEVSSTASLPAALQEHRLEIAGEMLYYITTDLAGEIASEIQTYCARSIGIVLDAASFSTAGRKRGGAQSPEPTALRELATLVKKGDNLSLLMENIHDKTY